MATARVAIIDYGSGNLRSVAKAFEQVGAATELVTTPAALAAASHIVLPGVGAYGDCMRGLQACPGMIEALHEQVRVQQKFFLGICVGMQMLFERGHEHGVHAGLGWFAGEVVPLSAPGLKVPHMGWNELSITRSSPQENPLLAGIENGAHAYFVHSYHAKLPAPDALLATTEYGSPITAVVGSGNIFGTQFHPEKSQQTGLRLLQNFVSLS
jgi:imidazole glycerol-phosphate synthase subunit HisH